MLAFTLAAASIYLDRDNEFSISFDLPISWVLASLLNVVTPRWEVALADVDNEDSEEEEDDDACAFSDDKAAARKLSRAAAPNGNEI